MTMMSAILVPMMKWKMMMSNDVGLYMMMRMRMIN